MAMANTSALAMKKSGVGGSADARGIDKCRRALRLSSRSKDIEAYPGNLGVMHQEHVFFSAGLWRRWSRPAPR